MAYINFRGRGIQTGTGPVFAFIGPTAYHARIDVIKYVAIFNF